MQVIIDIPEEQYITLNAKSQEEVLTVIDVSLLIKAIKNGTPLPKCHGRLIDEQDAIDTLSVMFSGNDEILNDALECIEQLPEVIEADGGDAE